MNKIKTYILSLDFIITCLIVLGTCFILPAKVPTTFAASFYNIGITVLSIVFSLFFAALAIIMSSTDSEFVLYLEEKKQFSSLMATFKFTLAILFLSLMYSIILNTTCEFALKSADQKVLHNFEQPKVLFLVFEFLFCYSLIATALSVKDTIDFTHYRTKYLLKSKAEKEAEKNKSTI